MDTPRDYRHVLIHLVLHMRLKRVSVLGFLTSKGGGYGVFSLGFQSSLPSGPPLSPTVYIRFNNFLLKSCIGDFDIIIIAKYFLGFNRSTGSNISKNTGVNTIE